MPITKTGPLPYLSDVADDLNPNDGDALVWSAAAQQWIAAPVSVTGGGEFVQKSGDTMTGPLHISSDETAPPLPGDDNLAFKVANTAGQSRFFVDTEHDAIGLAGALNLLNPYTFHTLISVYADSDDDALNRIDFLDWGPLTIEKLAQVSTIAPTTGWVLTWNGTEYVPQAMAVPVTTRNTAINFVIDGGGAAILPGIKGDLKIEQYGYLTGWTVMADRVGSVTIDVWKNGYFAYPPTAADSIFTLGGRSKPNLFNAITNSDALPAWVINQDDVLRFNVDAASTVQRLTVELKLQDTP